MSKSLKQIWDEQGGPFWARRENNYFYCSCISPKLEAVGWTHEGYSTVYIQESSGWDLCDDPTKPKKQFRYYRGEFSGSIYFSEERKMLDNWKDVTEQVAEALKPYLEGKK